jgi:hypothetical protein
VEVIFVSPTQDTAEETLEKQVIADARRMTGEPEFSTYLPTDPREFAGRIFHTCYMGTENSSPETRKRAKDLAEALGRSAWWRPKGDVELTTS